MDHHLSWTQNFVHLTYLTLYLKWAKHKYKPISSPVQKIFYVGPKQNKKSIKNNNKKRNKKWEQQSCGLHMLPRGTSSSLSSSYAFCLSKQADLSLSLFLLESVCLSLQNRAPLSLFPKQNRVLFG